MGRIRKNIEVDGNKYWALFDTGARNTYVVEEVAQNFHIEEFQGMEPVSLGGKVHNVNKDCILKCLIEGYRIRYHARVLDEIGDDESGKRIQVLIGALLMQEWGIILIPEEEKLDMTHYPKEFVEF